MPSNLPSSFASAAAGQNSTRDPRSGARGDGRGNTSGEWYVPCIDCLARTMNGTLTLRRTSTTPSSQAFSQPNPSESVIPSDDPAILAAMPVGSTVVENHAPPRYTREDMLAILSNMQGAQQPDVSTLFMSGWNPGHANGASSRAAWGKPAESHVLPQEPDMCWDPVGSTKAIGLQDMTTDEKELFLDVNSTMKPPTQNKEGVHPGGGMNGRKTSVSQATPLPSTTSRPGTRRRETSDTNPFSGGGGLNSPVSTNRPSRDNGSLWLDRKNPDAKDAVFEEPEELASRDAATKLASVAGVSRPSPWQTSSAGGLSGLGSFGNFALPGSTIGERRPGNPRGESRLAHLIPRDTLDTATNKLGDGPAAADPNRSWRSRPRTDTDPFGDEALSGSAVLGGAQDTSPPMSHAQLHTQSYDTPIKGSAGDFGMSGLNLGGHGDHDPTPLSPSETNPYRSPPGERGEHDENSDKLHHGFGGSGEPPSNYGAGMPRAFPHNAFDGSDRSQTSSVGAKGYPSLGNLSGWPSSSTPDRERAPFAPFGGSLFGGMGDMQSPGLGNLGGVFGPATTTGIGGSGSFSRGSKLGSLFPAAMQAQMQSHDNENLSDSIPDLRQPNPLGAIGRNTLNDHSREAESPMRPGRGVFANMFAAHAEGNRTPAVTDPTLHGSISTAPGQTFTATSNTPSYGAIPSEPPSAQARTMVMPDRMRWTYLDPQGSVQGPFTGLEMNDWYKANFFTPDLRVKKVEDVEFEPLGQLIRRIGNSREPFLVPQIGIPHGPPAPGGPFSANASGVIQPPLVGAFPSFGRTLTAEEQNNLERRKQEEQYLLARQREFISSQQAMGRMPMQGVPGLNHHSSAHSLHSQPSFGSMTSPITAPPQAPIGPIGTGGSFFDSLAARQPAAHGNSGPGLDVFREDELTHLTGAERQVLASMHTTGALGGNLPQQPIGAPSPEPGNNNQLPAAGELVEDSEGFRERLHEFNQLRAQHDAEAMEQLTQPQRQITEETVLSESQISDTSHMLERPNESETVKPAQKKESAASNKEFKEYQQAQAAAAAAKLGGLPMPFPPPPSGTPLPAPAPQRIRSNLPEQYANSSRSGTPDVSSATSTQLPPLAPWAKDGGVESHKGPSLKEIQQAEAVKAAKAEEAAALARRVMLEQEAARERERVAAAAPGLPTSSTWGTASPVSAGPVSSPWIKPVAGKGSAPAPSTPTVASDKKKTLADIQREEEARKQKAQQLASQSGLPSTGAKRYADLASKTNAASTPGTPSANNIPPATVGSGWATVGAGGKVKAPPTGPASQVRSASSTGLKPAPSVPAASPRPTLKSTTSAVGGGRTEAMDEFNKWLHSQLSRGITGVTDIDTFASTLMACPLIPEIISDAIYANSKTMDGRHFAQEFIRRKKLAEKGVVEKQPVNSPSTDTQSSSAGGWNEVAKKSNHKDTNSDTSSIQGAGFKNHSLSDSASANGATAARDAPESEPGMETFRSLCRRSLDIDGVSPYPYIPYIELFCLARFLFVTSDILPSTLSSPNARHLAWTRLRVHLWHYKLLTQPSLGLGSLYTKSGRWTDVATLEELIKTSLTETEADLFGASVSVVDGAVGETAWPPASQVLFRLEEANCHILLGNDTKAREALQDATRISGFTYSLSGALGKRTRFQEHSFSQLVVLAKSLQLQSEIVKQEAREAAPPALPLNDDTLLEKILFNADEPPGSESSLPIQLQDIRPDNQPELRPVDQIILLTEATLKDTFSPSDSLTLEEILPYAVRVIDDKSVNWQIYTQALLVRSRIELHRSRTVERGVLQMQAVADQVIVDTQDAPAAATLQSETTVDVPTIQVTSDGGSNIPANANKPTSFLPVPKPSESATPKERLEYVNALASPPRWHLESELAYAWTSVGSLVSALEIFKRLRLWPEVALCLASAAASEDSDGRGAGGEEKARAIVRWRLFQRSSGSKDSPDDVDDEDNVDIDSIKPRDFYGPERSPPPPNAPRLFCILGDVENDANHYTRAWEISNRRFARAQKSLGELHLQNKEWDKARQAYQLAVGVNRLSPELWNRLGDIELMLGHFPDAAEAFQRAIATANEKVGGEDARTWSNLGTAFLSWYREVIAEDKARKEKMNADEAHDMDEMISTKRATELGRSASQLLQDSLTAFKRGATVASTNWRIWDNVITIAASLKPTPAFDDIILGVRSIVHIRKTEEALDVEILTLLIREATKHPVATKCEDDPIHDPPRGTLERKVITLFEEDIVPLITSNSACWGLVSRLRAWRRDFAGALDASEKAWRTAIGAVGSSLSASTRQESWLTDAEAWDVVVQRTEELVAAYENYGSRLDSIGSRWKGKARSAIRTVLGKAKESWEDDSRWISLQGMLEELK
ncbi:gyf domain-containing protein [Xylaria cf. heliscus]|nr:gyf domain-containing protein [Xylaria cf. heliscus]